MLASGRRQRAIDAGHPEWADLPASMAEARALKEAGWPEGMPKQYFTGQYCKHGHISTRHTAGMCNKCNCVQMIAYQRTPKGKAKVKFFTTRYTSSPRGRAVDRASGAKRRATGKQATPAWLTQAHWDAMRSIYEDATARSATHQVDHIIPLVHPDVCGLHVPWNLQVLSKPDNMHKSNSFDGTMDNEGWRCETQSACAALVSAWDRAA